MIRRIRECERLRWWEGVAWFDGASLTAVVMPVGLHKACGIVRLAWHEFRIATHGPAAIDKAAKAGYRTGLREATAKAWQDGWDHGYERGIKHALEIIRSVMGK